MRIVTRSLLLFALLVLAACATPRQTDAAARANCDNVRCASCPEGQTPALKPPDCCKCVAIP